MSTTTPRLRHTPHTTLPVHLLLAVLTYYIKHPTMKDPVAMFEGMIRTEMWRENQPMEFLADDRLLESPVALPTVVSASTKQPSPFKLRLFEMLFMDDGVACQAPGDVGASTPLQSTQQPPWHAKSGPGVHVQDTSSRKAISGP